MIIETQIPCTLFKCSECDYQSLHKSDVEQHQRQHLQPYCEHKNCNYTIITQHSAYGEGDYTSIICTCCDCDLSVDVDIDNKLAEIFVLLGGNAKMRQASIDLQLKIEARRQAQEVFKLKHGREISELERQVFGCNTTNS